MKMSVVRQPRNEIDFADSKFGLQDVAYIKHQKCHGVIMLASRLTVISLLNSMLAPAPARFVAPSHVHEEPLPGDAIKMDEAISATSIILDSVE